MAKKCPNCNSKNTTLGYTISGRWWGKADVGHSPDLKKVYNCWDCGNYFK